MSDFPFRRYIDVVCVQSSIKLMKHFAYERQKTREGAKH